jgi:hypothetical protein
MLAPPPVDARQKIRFNRLIQPPNERELMAELTVVTVNPAGDGVYTGQAIDAKGRLHNVVANLETRGKLMAPAHEPSRQISLYDSTGTQVEPREVSGGTQKWQLAPGDYCRIETRAGKTEVVVVEVNSLEEVTLKRFRTDEYNDLPDIWKRLLPSVWTHP